VVIKVTVVTPRSGFDLEYYLNRVTAERTGGGYYLNAAQHGEAEGRWFGKGAEVFGLADGQKVTRDPYIAVYNMVDPRTSERLPGRAPGNYKKFDEIFQAKLAAEPHATGERRLQLEREAAQEVRRSPVYTDMTAAHAKSISILHGAFRENARRAHIAGDAKAEAVWRAREQRIQEILQAANHEALRWIEERAGYVRTGDHRKTGAVEGGRWAKAKIAVTTWLQGTNRDGEMHDHSHNVIARMALCDDGIYRAVDTMALRNQIGAMAAIIDAHVQSALTREFGVRWRVRADGKGHEIEGITDEDIALFSTRTQTVARKTAQLAREWARKYGREPNARELMFLADEANLVTRGGKDDEVIDWDKLAAKWDHRFEGKLAELAGKICHWGGRPGHEPTEQDKRQAVAEALAKVAARSTWTRSDLMRALSWSMGDRFSGMRGKDRQALLVELAEDAITGREVACL
jgi:TrwC relaxase